MRKSLIVVRAGIKSLHNAWVDRGTPRGWDLFVCPYEPLPFADEPQHGIHVGEVIPGAKWTGLRTLLSTWRGWKDYEYILLADDDLLATQAVWSMFFATCAAHGAKLAQPALTTDSSFSHLITVQNASFKVRRVGFVEIMMPCFHCDVLSEVLYTLDLTQTGWGWGLDALWPRLLDYKDVLIVDATPIFHSRPVGAARSPELHKQNIDEWRGIQQRFGAIMMKTCFGGIDTSNRDLNNDSIEFLRLYTAGYWDFIKDNRDCFSELMYHQLGLTFAA